MSSRSFLKPSAVAVAVLIGLLASSASVCAADTSPIQEIDDLNQVLLAAPSGVDACVPTPANKEIKNVVFMFEGHGGYSETLNNAFNKFQAMSPSCTHLLEGGRDIVQFANGMRMDFNRVRDQFHSMVPGPGSPVGLKNLILNDLCKHSAMDLRDTHVVYLPQDADLNAATDCAKRILKTSPFAKLTVMGYSYGGSAAVKFANQITREGHHVSLGITVDPVPQNAALVAALAANELFGRAEFALGATSTPPSARQYVPELEAPVNTRWINFWQTVDNRFDHGANASMNAGIHGHPVRGASVNHWVQPPLNPSVCGASNGGHWRIFDDQVLNDTVASELSAQR